MNPVKKKLAAFLLERSKQILETLDPSSPCARAFDIPARDTLLKEDIQRICDEVHILEAARVLRVFAKLTSSRTEGADRYKRQLRSIFSEVITRVEEKHGALNLPLECRDLVMGL